MTYSIDDLLAARQTVLAFVSAVAVRDEATAERLLYPETAANLGATSGTVAATFRKAWAVPDALISRLGATWTARILPEGRVGFGLVEDNGRTELTSGPRPAYALALVLDGDQWRVWGTPDPEEWSNPVEMVNLPPPATGPIH